MLRRWSAAIIACGVLEWSRPALAAEDDAKRQAQAQLHRGTQLWETDKPGACQSFRQGMAAYESATLLAWVAECDAIDGKLRQARAGYVRALALNVVRNKDNPKQLDSLRALVERKLQELEAQMEKVSITLDSRPDGLVIELDGEQLNSADLEGPIWVGRLSPHRLVARASGYEDVTVSGDTQLHVELRPLASREPSPAPVTAAVTARPAPEDAALPSSAPARLSLRRPVGYALGATGLVALGVAGYFGLETLASVNEAEKSCDRDGCEAPGLTKLAEARRSQNLGFVLAGVGVVAASVGVALVVTAPPRAPARVARLRLRLGPTSIVAAGEF